MCTLKAKKAIILILWFFFHRFLTAIYRLDRKWWNYSDDSKEWRNEYILLSFKEK